MPPTRLGLSAVVLVAATAWMLLSLRVITLPLFVTTLILTLRWARGGHLSRLLQALGLYVLLGFSPVDLRFKNVEGPPRFVRALSGYPKPGMRERIRRDEFYWVGDVNVTPIPPPRWVLVW